MKGSVELVGNPVEQITLTMGIDEFLLLRLLERRFVLGGGEKGLRDRIETAFNSIGGNLSTNSKDKWKQLKEIPDAMGTNRLVDTRVIEAIFAEDD